VLPEAAGTIQCHRESHGETGDPSAIIQVDPAAVEAFLGTKDPSEVSHSYERTMRAVRFTDISSSTEMTARLHPGLG
jgi:hypothetical protein